MSRKVLICPAETFLKMVSDVINAFVFWCHPAILLHRVKADLTLLDENRNTALHLACSKVCRVTHESLH